MFVELDVDSLLGIFVCLAAFQNKFPLHLTDISLINLSKMNKTEEITFRET